MITTCSANRQRQTATLSYEISTMRGNEAKDAPSKDMSTITWTDLVTRPETLQWYMKMMMMMMMMMMITFPTYSSHSDTSHLVRLLWTSDRSVAKASNCTTHNTDKSQTSTLPAGIEPAIPATERPHIHALASAASGIDGLWASEANFRSTEIVSYVNNPCT